jgi:hypothetical protein
MASGKAGPAFRLKGKRKDGTEVVCKDREGEDIKLQRFEVGICWDNDGKLSFKFTDERAVKALTKAFGGECWFDLYDNRKDGPSSAKSEPDDDDDF